MVRSSYNLRTGKNDHGVSFDGSNRPVDKGIFGHAIVVVSSPKSDENMIHFHVVGRVPCLI